MQMRSLFFIALLTIIFGCASKTKKAVNEEMAKTTPAKSEKELITQEDKMEKSQKENQNIEKDSMKTKSLLFKELMSQQNNYSKINFLEDQLLKLNKKKTKNTINTYREAKNIVGKYPPNPLDENLMMLDRKVLHDF